LEDVRAHIVSTTQLIATIAHLNPHISSQRLQLFFGRDAFQNGQVRMNKKNEVVIPINF